jgi:hypothetical protein
VAIAQLTPDFAGDVDDAVDALVNRVVCAGIQP